MPDPVEVTITGGTLAQRKAVAEAAARTEGLSPWRIEARGETFKLRLVEAP